MNVEVRHNSDKRKFYAIVDHLECYLEYSEKGPTMLDYHLVFVPVPLRERKIASQITEEALRYAQKNNYQVIPTCSFVDWYIDHHHEYAKIRVQDLNEIE